MAAGTTCEPKRPRIVQTSMNIEIPPPIDIEYLVRLKIAEHIKQKPAKANIVRNAPRLKKRISPKLMAKVLPPTIQIDTTLTAVTSRNMASSDTRR